MNFEKRANNKFCFKLGKPFTDTHNLLEQVYGDNCLSRTRVYEGYKSFQEGREDIQGDEHPGPSNTVVTLSNIENVRELIKNEPKSSLRYLRMELNMSKDSIHRILIDHLNLRKVCARFVPHKLTDYEKSLRIQHCKDLIKESRKDPNFKYSIVTGDETWCFRYDPETKRQSAECKHPTEPIPKKSRLEK